MSNKKVYRSWRKSVEKDDVTKSISVRECENGFVIDICVNSHKDGEYKYDEKTYISTKNPLEGEQEYKEEIDATDEIMKAIDALNIDN